MQNGYNHLKYGHFDEQSSSQHVQHKQITLGLQHKLQFRVTMAATDATLFYLYFAHSTSSLFKLTTTTTAAAAWESFVDGLGDKTWVKLAPFPHWHCV